ncbi:MAG: S-adenosylmethionine:tRNA ribosyltransferase-isomerase, partial [Candidatus Caenarcaniphilales bacterium]|nr:S-adenosylmethionine:tRNA ribosyltransferase-isomerase [Candidatus Caenarcaniphilales bacterium]
STSVRTLETVFNTGQLRGDTNIFIYPGYQFKIVDAMITNFHLPKSSLILMVSAFIGSVETQKVYHHAIKNSYRFYSYGDASLLML